MNAIHNNFLRNGERLLWSGAPVQGLHLKAADALMIPFSMLWGGFAVFWNVSVWAINAPILFRLWGLPFLLMGAYITFGRFFHDAWRRSRTVYALTDQRAIIATRTPNEKVRSTPVVPDTSIEIERGKRTSIWFGERPSMLSRGNGIGAWSAAPGGFVFESIRDGERVAAHIDALQRSDHKR